MDYISVNRKGQISFCGISIGMPKKDLPAFVRDKEALDRKVYVTYYGAHIDGNQVILKCMLDCFDRVSRIEAQFTMKYDESVEFYEKKELELREILEEVKQYKGSKVLSYNETKAIGMYSKSNEIVLTQSFVVGYATAGVVFMYISEFVSGKAKAIRTQPTRRDKFKIAVAVILIIYGFLFLLNNRYEQISGNIVLDKWRGGLVELDIRYQR